MEFFVKHLCSEECKEVSKFCELPKIRETNRKSPTEFNFNGQTKGFHPQTQSHTKQKVQEGTELHKRFHLNSNHGISSTNSKGRTTSLNGQKFNAGLKGLNPVSKCRLACEHSFGDRDWEGGCFLPSPTQPRIPLPPQGKIRLNLLRNCQCLRVKERKLLPGFLLKNFSCALV